MVMIPGSTARLGDMPAGGNDPIPEGTYHLRSDKVELRTVGPNAKNKGASMAAVMFTVFGPEEQEETHGRKLFENFILVGEGLWRARQFFEACGEGADFVIEDTDQFLDREVAAVVGIEKGTPDPRDPSGVKMYPDKNIVKRFLSIP